MADKYPNRPLIVLGTAGIGDATVDPELLLSTPEQAGPFFDEFYNRGYRVIDTARNYPPSAPGTAEPVIARHNTDGRFVVDTKVFSFTPGDHSEEGLSKSIDGSIAVLGGHPINVEYLHVPERTTPFADTLAAMNKFLGEGKFKKIGISNYPVEEVQQLLDITAKNKYAPISVFQGCYNPISRSIERDLFPLLRKNNIAFYAYSPAAGGAFSEKKRPGSRFESSGLVGSIYQSMYKRPKIDAALEKVRTVSAAHKIPGHDASLRWTVYHSQLSGEHGDAVIVGASNLEQLKKNLDAIDAGPLPKELVDAVEAVQDAIDEEDKLQYKF